MGLVQQISKENFKSREESIQKEINLTPVTMQNKSSATKSDSLRKCHTILECNERRFSHSGLLNINICLQHYSKIQ